MEKSVCFQFNVLIWDFLFFFLKQRILREVTYKRYCLLVVCSKAATDKQFSPTAVCGGEECIASHRQFSAPNCLPWKSFLSLTLLAPQPERRHMPFYCLCSSPCETFITNDLNKTGPLVASFTSFAKKQVYLKHGQLFFLQLLDLQLQICSFFFSTLLVFTVSFTVKLLLMSKRMRPVK